MSKKLAFVFPGQGSQSVGMLAELASISPIVTQTFAEASEQLGYDLWELTQNGPVEKLNQTTYTQPALLVASMAVWRVWKMQTEAIPLILAGHSLGEYTALVCAEVLDFATAVKLVAERGRLMQEAVPEGIGAMAAIVGLSEVKIQELCKLAAQGQVLQPANYNAIGQVVIAGHRPAIERALILTKEAGAKMAKELSVSVPSHCELMKHAAEQLSVQLRQLQLQAPKIPIINNVDVTVTGTADALKDALIRQLYNPVRWVETIQLMAKQGIELIIECGSGKILAGLNKRIESNIPTISVNNPESLNEALAVL